ncbi:MAG: RNA methyltransferase [Owenweeksia sp.]
MRKLQMHELNRISVEEFKQSSKHPIVVVLDNVRSVLNVGSVFRTCDAFKIEHLWLCGVSPTPENKEMRKTALGGTESVDWSHSENTLTVVSELRQKGYTVIGIEQTTNAISLEKSVAPAGPVAYIFGNEVKGIQNELLPLCDEIIEIPQFGTKHSLNVSVSAGIVLWKAIEPYLK